MRLAFLIVAMWICTSSCGQHAYLTSAKSRHSTSLETSRLVALVELGTQTKTSLLIEAGDLDFLQAPISISISNDRTTKTELIKRILAGPEHYTVEQRGKLLVVYPTQPAKPLNRILSLSLGPFAFKEKAISSLNPLIAYYIQMKTGCHPQGWLWGGPPLDLDIPPFSLPAATFEDIVEQVAKAPEPTMWVVEPDDGRGGCIDNPEEHWQVGFYSDDPARGNPIFRQSVGPQLVR